MSAGAAFVYGVAGGLIAEFLAVARHRKIAPEDLPKYMKGWFYWACGGGYVLLGGFLASVYAGAIEGFNAILALNVGATGPLLAEQLIRSAPKLPPGSVD